MFGKGTLQKKSGRKQVTGVSIPALVKKGVSKIQVNPLKCPDLWALHTTVLFVLWAKPREGSNIQALKIKVGSRVGIREPMVGGFVTLIGM